MALAILFTFLNALKPLSIDDTLYHYHGEQIAQHPLNPYGFRVFRNDRPEPAIQALAPVLMQSWWAIAIRILGQQTKPWAGRLARFRGPLFHALVNRPY